MEYTSITFAASLSACILSALLSAVFIFLWSKRLLVMGLAIAALSNTAWLGGVLYSHSDATFQGTWLVVLEAFHYAAWIFGLSQALVHSAHAIAPLGQRLLHLFSWILAIGSLVLCLTLPGYLKPLSPWLNLILSVIAIFSVEQLYKNTFVDRQIKLLCLNLAAVFIYDVYLHSHDLLFSETGNQLFQARAAIAMATSFLMAMGAVLFSEHREHPAGLALSRPIALYSTSLIVTGLFITIISAGGYFVKNYGGNWSTVLYTFIMFCAVMAIAIVFVSSTVRSRLTVLVNKHLFSHKYDYRTEWLRLINYLSEPSDTKNSRQRAFYAVASIFNCPGGAIWIKKDEFYYPEYQIELPLNYELPKEPEASPFCEVLREAEWVFSPNSIGDNELSRYNDRLPEWTKSIPDLWLILPLVTANELVGFMMLTRPTVDTALTWEDLDLLKAVGRQLADYLKRHEQAEMLAESRQFDAYNKLVAFIIHDLNNLIAQQALVVKNADKHKGNPEFFEDTIQTISNSVSRMTNLLAKLNRREAELVKSLSMHELLIKAIDHCSQHQPTPELSIPDGDYYVKADRDRLGMAITHLIKNAQEATTKNGWVKISLNKIGKQAVIDIIDNGIGMDSNFIQNALFKPFETTKSGKGMGIGVYQSREYIQSLGGSLTVSSTLGKGTTFTLKLPLQALS